MKRMRKLGIVLSVLLIMSLLFAACGGSNNKDGGTTNQSSTSNGSDGNGGSTSSSNSEQSSNTSEQKEELEPVTLKMYVPGVPQKDQQLVNDAISEYLKDKINVTLDMEVIDWGSWQDKMQLKFATNEEFDILLTMSWDNWAGKIANGTIIPLDDLIEKYAKEAAAQLSPIVLNGIKWEGKTYGFPTNKEFASNKGFMVRKDLVDKYNFDLSTVKKPEDMGPFFEVIKQNEPGVTPFLSGRDVGLNIALQEGYWISAGSVAKNVGWMDRYTPELEIIDVFSDPRYMDILKLSRKW